MATQRLILFGNMVDITNLVFVFSVHPSNNIGIMFLNEVALGKEYTITQDDCSLRKAPAGYDSVVARGSEEPGFSTYNQISFLISLFTHVVQYVKFCITLASWQCLWSCLIFFFFCLDLSKDVFIELDGKKVAVPQGKAIKQQQYQGSSFWNSEYLIYKENQCRIRYLLELKFSH